MSRAVFLQTLFHDHLETLRGRSVRERVQGEPTRKPLSSRSTHALSLFYVTGFCYEAVWKLLDEVTLGSLLRRAVHWPAVPELTPDSCMCHRCDPKHLMYVMGWATLQA